MKTLIALLAALSMSVSLAADAKKEKTDTKDSAKAESKKK